jgi:nucleotide-binding universal stress UspA family protein
VDHTLTVQGSILETIVEQAGKLDIDLLIMGSRHYGALYRLWHGDMATGAASRAPCALLLVPI